MSFVSMSKASVVQPDKRFTLPLEGEALSPKKLVDLAAMHARQIFRISEPNFRKIFLNSLSYTGI